MSIIQTCNKANTEFGGDSALDHTKVEPQRVSRYYEFLEKYFDPKAVTSTAEGAAWDLMTKTHKRQSLLAELGAVAPQQLRRIDAWLANTFDVNDILGLRTGAGDLRQNLLAVQATAQNQLNVLARIAENQRLRKTIRKAEDLASKHGVKGRRAFSNLFREAVEVGQIPHRIKATTIGDKVSSVFSPYSLEHKFAARRFNDFINKLDGLGFAEPEIRELLTSATEYSVIQRSIKTEATRLGVDVGELAEGTGYFTRIVTPEARQYLQRLRNTDPTFEQMLSAYDKGDTASVRSAFEKLRTTTVPLPKQAFDATSIAFWNSGARGGFKSVEDLRDGLTNLALSDTTGYLKWLKDNVEPRIIDELTNDGILQQIPMTSSEVADWWGELYRLPNGVKFNLFESDPAKVLQEYANDLGRAAGQHQMFKYVQQQGYEQGWSLPNGLYQKYKRQGFPEGLSESDFVNIQSANLWDRLNIDTKNLPLSNNWVYRPAAEVFGGLIKMQASPAQLSNFANGLQKMLKLNSTSILLGGHFKYVFKVFAGNGAAAFAGTGYNPMAITAMFARNEQVARALGKRTGFGVFDNTQKIFSTKNGKTYTAKELIEGIYALRNSDGVPLTSVSEVDVFSAGPKAFMESLGNPAQTARRVFEYATWSADPDKVTKGFGRSVVDGAQYLFGVSYKESVEKLFAPLAYAANLSDLGTRMAIIELMSDQFDTLEDALRHTDQYIPRPDSSGSFTRTASKFYAPFMRYMMWSMGSSLRHMYKHPNKYSAINKAVSFFNNQQSQGCETPVPGVEPWMRDQYSIVLGCSADGDPYVLYTNNYDAITDGVTRVAGGITNLFRLAGQPDPSDENQRGDIIDRGGVVGDIGDGLVSQSYWSGLVDAWTGDDSFTGRPLQEVELRGGVTIPPRVASIMETVLPLSRFATDALEVERMSANEFGVRGPREPQPYPELRALGLNVRRHDVARNLQYSISAMRRDREAIDRAIKDLKRDRNEAARLGQDFSGIDADIKRLAEAQFVIRVDELRVRQYAQSRGVPMPEAIRQVNEAYELMGEAATAHLPQPQEEAVQAAYEEYTKRLLNNGE